MLEAAAPMDMIGDEAVEAARPSINRRARAELRRRRTGIGRGVDLDIAPGRRTVVMGSNGAGKCLLLRLLHGLLRPTSGRVLWKGRPLDATGRRAQAMVFQRPVMLRRSVLANLDFALRVHGVRGPARRERERSALALARLEDLAGRPPRVLSGGEQQRLAVARALACDPELLFLDEPTASLDPASTHAIEMLIREAHAAGSPSSWSRMTARRRSALATTSCSCRVAGSSRRALRPASSRPRDPKRRWPGSKGAFTSNSGEPERSQEKGDQT